MAEYTIVQVKRDSTLNWYASNPRLALGEPGVDMDLHRFKIGNGIDRWNELPYMDDDLYKLLDKQQQKTADDVQSLLNRILANKLDADQKYNAATTEIRNTSRDLTGRMTAVETGQQEYQQNLTERQQEYEEALTGDFEDTKAEVQAGLDEFSETRDQLTTRMDVIAGQATEDTEILDARVDAESRTHPNLGENIRNIHSELLGVKASGAEERTTRIAENEAERTARLTADKTERAERISTDERHEAEIARLSDRTEKLSEHGEYLQEQTTANAEAELAVQEQLFREIQRHRETERGLEQEITARESADDALNEAVRAEAQRISDLESATSRKETELAGRLDTEKQLREQADDELKDWNAHSDARTSELGEFLQEQADELAGVVAAEAVERQKDKQELRQVIAGTAEKLEGLVSDETLLREKKDAELASEIASNAKHDALKDDYLQEQADQNAQANIQMARNLLQETEYRRRDIQSVREEIGSEKLERARDTDNIREKHSADISRLEDADSIAAKIRHDENSGLQEQINELADLRIKDALKSYKKRLQAKADKQHEDTRQQAEKEYQTNQINELADGIFGVILYVCQTCKKLRAHIKLIENALVDWGVLNDDDIPPTTETEIDGMFEDIFSGNTSGETIEPDDEDEAEFLEDINNIFNP